MQEISVKDSLFTVLIRVYKSKISQSSSGDVLYWVLSRVHSWIDEAVSVVRGLCVSVYADFHRTAPYVITGSVDLTVKIWECRWVCSSFIDCYRCLWLCAVISNVTLVWCRRAMLLQSDCLMSNDYCAYCEWVLIGLTHSIAACWNCATADVFVTDLFCVTCRCEGVSICW